MNGPSRVHGGRRSEREVRALGVAAPLGEKFALVQGETSEDEGAKGAVPKRPCAATQTGVSLSAPGARQGEVGKKRLAAAFLAGEQRPQRASNVRGKSAKAVHLASHLGEEEFGGVGPAEAAGAVKA